MIVRKSILITLKALFVSLILISTSLAQDSLLISYQGHVTDNGGDPLTGTPSMTFTIYDAGGVSKWSESHPDVSVDNGLFAVILGSQTALPDSVFKGEDRYLGISIEGDDEIDPRTLLTSAPGAAISRRVIGDIHTAPGKLVVTDETGASSITMETGDGSDGSVPWSLFVPTRTYWEHEDVPQIFYLLGAWADSTVVRVNAPDDCVPPDPCTPALEMVAEPDKNIIRVHPPEPCVPPEPCDPAIEIASTTQHHSITISQPLPDDNRPAIKLLANNENKIDLYYPDGESDEGIVQIGANAAEGAFIELHAADSLTVTRVIMGGSTTDTGFVRLMGGADNFEYKLLELTSHTNTGGNINFFDPANADRRELLSIGSVPDAAGGAARELMSTGSNLADGIGIYGFNPQPEPPGHIAFELTNEFLDNPGGRFAVYNTEDATVSLSGGLMQIGHKDISYYPTGIFGVTSTTSQLTLTGDASAGDAPIITMVAGVDGAKVGIGTDSPSDELYVIGDITATGAITELSSLKYKTNINQLSDALEKVSNLRGVNYTWRTDEYPEMKLSDDQQVGLIAEEVEKVIPQLVHSDNNGEKSINYSKLSAVLIEAIKDQQKLIRELSKRVEELEEERISSR